MIKKMLSILGVFGLTVSLTTGAVACDTTGAIDIGTIQYVPLKVNFASQNTEKHENTTGFAGLSKNDQVTQKILKAFYQELLKFVAVKPDSSFDDFKINTINAPSQKDGKYSSNVITDYSVLNNQAYGAKAIPIGIIFCSIEVKSSISQLFTGHTANFEWINIAQIKSS